MMLNSEWPLKLAQRLADEADGIDQVYERCFGRAPTAKEHAAAQAFADESGMAELCHALFNASEFVYLD